MPESDRLLNELQHVLSAGCALCLPDQRCRQQRIIGQKPTFFAIWPPDFECFEVQIGFARLRTGLNATVF
jgi:hypothetical protein